MTAAADPRRVIGGAVDGAQPRLDGVALWIYETLLESGAPTKAYDLIALRMAQGIRCHPPTIYRGLAELEEAGRIHKVDRLKAYMICTHPHRGGRTARAIIVCTSCGAASEAPPPAAGDADALFRDTGFELREVIVEAAGLCPGCRASPRSE